MKKTLKLLLLLCLILGLQGVALAETNQGSYDNKTFLVSFFYFTVDENTKTTIYDNQIETSKELEKPNGEKIESIALSLYKYKLNPPYKETNPQYRVGLMIRKKTNNDYILSHIKPIKITYTTKNNDRKNITIGGSNEYKELSNVLFSNRHLDTIETAQIEELKNATKITAELTTTDNKTFKIDFPAEILAEWQHIINTDIETVFPKDLQNI